MSIYRFAGLVLLLMLPCFALWYALGNLTPAPGLWLGQLMLTLGWPDVVHSVTYQGHEFIVMTQFAEAGNKVVPLQQGEYQLGYPLNTRTLTYSIPFYLSLHFATRMPDSMSRLAVAMLVLWALIALGIVAVTLKNLMLGLGSALFDSATLPLPPPSVIALLFQFSTLIVPTVGPVLLWAWLGRDSALWQGLLGRQ